MNKIYIVAAAFFLASCASNTGVVEAGTGSYFIEKQQATGAPGLGNLRAEIYNEANAFCRTRNTDMKVVSYSQTEPPYILGNYPRVSLSFSC
jgi:hypothetical protein